MFCFSNSCIEVIYIYIYTYIFEKGLLIDKRVVTKIHKEEEIFFLVTEKKGRNFTVEALKQDR